MAQPGLIDFSPIGELGDVFQKAQERAKASAFEDALRGMAGGTGPIDYNALVRQAMAAGYTPGIELGSKLKQAEALTQYHQATQAEQAQHNRAIEAAYNRPQIIPDPPNPFNPTAPRGYTAIYSDKRGNSRVERGTYGGGGAVAAPPVPTPSPNPAPTLPPAPSVPGVTPVPFVPGGASLEQPGGPALAQAPNPFFASPSDEIIARAQGLAQAAEPPGPQYAEAGPPGFGSFTRSPAGRPSVTVGPAPPAPPAVPSVVPSWAGSVGVAPTPPAPEPPNPLGINQRGDLRYIAPLGPFNEGAIAHLPPGAQATVRQLATGRASLQSIRGKEAQDAYHQAVNEYTNGTFDMNMYKRKVDVEKDFSTGLGAKNVAAINNLTNHLETAREVMSNLGNTQTPAWNAAVNKFREITGYQGELPAQVKAIGPIVAGEMAKVVAGTGAGGVGERIENELRTMSTATSPKAMNASLNRIQELMISQMQTQEQRYETNTYNTDFRNKLLSGKARVLMDQFEAHPQGVGRTPAVGAIEEGYQFLGGDPHNPKSWKKVP